ncbi:Glycerate kinase [Purpureocillium lavendulum]|uniref:Glycerate kinase n=1 Tax=Purpureocillium lavendulum TaxID=1247861 RepID=A0AB34FDR5_9HYPO|nr:Glycerate kinase [Purpureocillium lavendulum]
MKKDPGLSTKRAAKIYNVPRTTLRRRQNGTPSRRESPPNSAKLTELEEKTIVEYVLDLVGDLANRLLADRDAPRVGANWASNFVKRQPELRTRFFRRYDYKRAQCEDPDAINAWFCLVRNTVAKYGIQEVDMYNFDETGFQMGVIAKGMVVTSSERRSNVKLRQPGNREWVTVIQGVGALGFCGPPFIVVSGKYHLSTWYQDDAISRDWRIATSPNGWTTNEIGLDWIRHFNEHTKPRTLGAFRLLVLDGHESHLSVNFELYCKDNKIITLCMPAHSSHLLQPLDVGCFGPLKKAYGRQVEMKMRAGTTHITKEDFFPAFWAAFQQAMTPENIQGGFRGAGLVPHNSEAVLSKLDVKLKTPTPPGTSHGETNTWVSKTPTTATEAGSQSDFIKGRISRHQGSSPTSIIEAVEHFAKGAKGIMHRFALMETRMKMLEEENATLSKRRRAKKTRLRGGQSEAGNA